MTRGRRLDALCRAGLEVAAQPISAQLRSPFDEENELGDALGALRGPHFIAGRLAAHAAVRALHRDAVPLPRGVEGDVRWPSDLVGAVAHTPDIAVAVVGESSRYLGAGIDVERAERSLAPGSQRIVARSEEEPWLAAPPDSVVGEPLVALTSAKEVVFKVYFPCTGIRLRFVDATITPTPAGFTASLTRDLGLPGEFEIERAVLDGYIVLAGALHRP